jgi:hypothetical protein
MPAVSAAAVNLNHLRVLVLLQRRNRHSLSRGDSSQSGACKKAMAIKFFMSILLFHDAQGLGSENSGE